MLVIAINIATCAMMLAASIRSGSTALLSGTLDNFGDALTYALSLLVVGASVAAQARVALLKAALILGAAVGVQIALKPRNPDMPIIETMGIAAVLNLAASGLCLLLLNPYRHDDINRASSWDCSRNDVFEGLAVLAAAGATWLAASRWPDLIIAGALLVMFLRSAVQVFAGIRGHWRRSGQWSCQMRDRLRHGLWAKCVDAGSVAGDGGYSPVTASA